MTGPLPDERPHLAMPFRHWWKDHVVRGVDHPAVVAKVEDDAGWSAHFGVMTLLSAGIAVLGLLLSSPAVVIGAMLISPLMGPIIGLGFALAIFDSAEMRRSLKAVAAGVVLAVAFCALIVLLSPLRNITDEIAARTHPNLFDFLVALFSGLAGTYAMIRGRHGAIVGVAIATALMPPLAVVGFGLATANWQVLAGSFLLFFTNLATIAAAAAILARLYGFAENLSPRQTGLQASLVTLTLVAVAVPLALSLRQIAWEALASRGIDEAIASHFGANSRVSDVEIDYRARPISVEAMVLTPSYKPSAEQALESRLTQRLNRPVRVSIDQIRTGGDAATMALASARGGAERRAERLAEQLSLVAGVSPEEVLVDERRKRAQVRAAVLPGASLDAYRALEERIAAGATGWTVILVPPPALLPPVEFAGEEPSEAGNRALRTTVWAGRRLRLPIGIAGRRQWAERVATFLVDAGMDARIVDGGGGSGVRLSWLAPDDKPTSSSNAPR